MDDMQNPAVDPRFTTLPAQQRRFKTVARKMGFRATTKTQWQAWRRKFGAKLRELTGYATLRKAPLKPRVTETMPWQGVTRQRVEIQVEPGVWMPFYALIPSGRGPFSAVLCPHGHGNSAGKHATAGVREHPDVAKSIEQHNYDYGVQFARAGLIAFCPDARGFGERREPGVRGGLTAKSCAELNARAIPLGQTVAGMWAWDLSRLVDYAATRKDCRPGAVGCAGLSGGGLQTLYATAMDERIRAAVVSGYFYGAKESLLDFVCCWCNYVPHLYEYADMGDLAALIAPRPLLIETGDKDGLNGASGVKNTTSQVAIARKAYRLLKANAQLKQVVFDGEHRWHGEISVPWLVEQLR